MSGRWSVISAVSGVVVALVLVVAFDVAISWALVVVGVWIIAGAVLRVLVDYWRATRNANRGRLR